MELYYTFLILSIRFREITRHTYEKYFLPKIKVLFLNSFLISRGISAKAISAAVADQEIVIVSMQLFILTILFLVFEPFIKQTKRYSRACSRCFLASVLYLTG